jgi:hypothetical protein
MADNFIIENWPRVNLSRGEVRKTRRKLHWWKAISPPDRMHGLNIPSSVNLPGKNIVL